MAGPWEKYAATPLQDTAEVGPWTKFGAPAGTPPVAPEAPGLLRKGADLALDFTQGAYGAIGAGASAFGADNLVAKGATAISDYAVELQSGQRQAERQAQAQRMQEAEATGRMWEEAKAAGQNVLDTPLSFFASALGSLVPTAAASVVGGAPAALTLGAGMGAGAVKQSVAEHVEQEALKAGQTPEQAAAAAAAAQAYQGDNLDQIALGAGLGALAGGTGVERLMGGGASVIKNLVGRAAAGAVTEAVPEAVQGGQERLAANVAAQRDGFGGDTWTGVVGQGVTEGLASTGPGGIAGAMTPYLDPNAGPISRAAIKAQEQQAAGALPAPGQLSGEAVMQMGDSAPGQDPTGALDLQRRNTELQDARAKQEAERAAVDPTYLDRLNGRQAAPQQTTAAPVTDAAPAEQGLPFTQPPYAGPAPTVGEQGSRWADPRVAIAGEPIPDPAAQLEIDRPSTQDQFLAAQRKRAQGELLSQQEAALLNGPDPFEGQTVSLASPADPAAVAAREEAVQDVAFANGDEPANVRVFSSQDLPDGPSGNQRGADLTRPAAAVIEGLGRLFGTQYRFYDSPNAATRGDGFVLRGRRPGVAYVRATEGDAAPLVVAGHETYHTFSPAERTRFSAAIEPFVDVSDVAQLAFLSDYTGGRYQSKVVQLVQAGVAPTEIIDAVIDQAQQDGVANLDRAKLREEFDADIFGNRMKDTGFWEKVFTELKAQDRTLLVKIRDSIKQVVSYLKSQAGKVRGFDTDRYIRDLDAVQRIAARTLLSAANTQQKGERGSRGAVDVVRSEVRDRLGPYPSESFANMNKDGYAKKEGVQYAVEQAADGYYLTRTGATNEGQGQAAGRLDRGRDAGAVADAGRGGQGDSRTAAQRGTAGRGESAPRQGRTPLAVESRVRTDERGAVSLTGVHYSREPRRALSGSYYGTGLKGAEGRRLAGVSDRRLLQRVYAYVNEGKGVRPEAGVGSYPHTVEMSNLYDLAADPLKLYREHGGDLNLVESAILDVGFDGYYVRDAFGNQGAAVVLGDASIGLQAQQVEAEVVRSPKRESDVGHKRTKAGDYVGAPPGTSSPQKLAAMRKQIRRIALEGEVGRFWYEDSSRAILAIAEGNPALAEKIAGLLAIYSPQATVSANTTMALKALYQWMNGQPIKARMAATDAKAQGWMDGTLDEKSANGIKTGNFFKNLMRKIDEARYGYEQQGATIDMWMARVFGYNSKAIGSEARYYFAERETKRLADELGWEPQQVQAAIWVAIKSRVEAIADQAREEGIAKGWLEKKVTKAGGKENVSWPPKDGASRELYEARILELALAQDPDPKGLLSASYHFGTALAERMGQISWEAKPGATTGVLQGIFSAPIEQQVEYLNAIDGALRDEAGVDLIAKKLGLPVLRTVFGPSAWQMDVGAGAQSLTAIATTRNAQNKMEVSADARELLNLYAAIRGYVLNQEAVVWHYPLYDRRIDQQNGIEVQFGRDISHDEMQVLYRTIADVAGHSEWAPAVTPGGVRVLNFTDAPNKDFHAQIKQALERLPDTFDGWQMSRFASDGDYIFNDWIGDRNGEGYRSRIGAARQPDLQEWVDRELAPRVAAVNRAFSETYGWGAATLDDREAAAGEVTRSTRRNELGFYSQLSRAVDASKFQTQPAGQWKLWLASNAAKAGVKANEVQWSGINEWLELQGKRKVEKAEVLQYLEQGGVQIQEVQKGANGPAAKAKALRELGWPTDQVAQLSDRELEAAYIVSPEDMQDFLDRHEAYEDGMTLRDAIERADAYGFRPEQPQPDTRYGNNNLVLPGGENYREVLLTLPEPDRAAAAKKAGYTVRKAPWGWQIVNPAGDGIGMGTGATADEALADWAQVAVAHTGGRAFKSGHWDEQNVLAHVRLNDRTTTDGRRVLFVEEIQSDWGQAGRDAGFGDVANWTDAQIRAAVEENDPNADTEGLDRATLLEMARNSGVTLASSVPAAPFVQDTKSWVSLALKRVISMAAEGGYDSVAVVNGQQSADRYSLRKQIESIGYDPKTQTLTGYNTRRAEVLNQAGVAPAQVADYVGKEVAQRLLATELSMGKHLLSGEEIEVGGDGMKAFYDRIVPQVANDVLKKLGGGRVAPVPIRMPYRNSGDRNMVVNAFRDQMWSKYGDGFMLKITPEEAAQLRALEQGQSQTQLGFDITPAMREKVTGDGLPLFSAARTRFDPEMHRDFIGDVKRVLDLGRRGKDPKQTEMYGRPIQVMRTPPVLRAVYEKEKANSRPFRQSEAMVGTGASIYLKSQNLFPGSDHGRAVDMGAVSRLPYLLADPLAVFQSTDQGDDPRSFKVLGTDSKGFFVAALKPGYLMKGASGKTNFSATIYPTDLGQIQDWLKKGTLRYWDDRLGKGEAQGITGLRTDYLGPLSLSNGPDWLPGGTKSLSEMFSLSKAPVKIITRSELEGTPEVMLSARRGSGDTIDVDGKTRPTYNSNGRPIAQSDDALRSFWRWFGDSKMVDDRGRPLVLYHSSLADLTRFNRAGTFMGHTGTSGISVTDNPAMASRYLERYADYGWVDGEPNQPFSKNIMALYVKAENPLFRDEPFQTNLRLGAPLPEDYVSPVVQMGYDALVRNDAISRTGSVKHSSAKNAIRGREIVVFNPEQIKSVTGNSGAFDPADLDITRSARRAQTETPEFKRWFGDSKVVDGNGQPLVVYHGGAKGITAFDKGKIGASFGYDKDGFFFTTERGQRPGTADNYAGDDGEVYPVYLSLQNPYTLAQFAADLDLEVADLVIQEGSPQSPITVFDVDREEITRRVREGGYDGVAFQIDYGDGTNEGMFVALEPEQIKSATGNAGTFDPADPDITRSAPRANFGDMTQAQEDALRAVGLLREPKTVRERFAELTDNLAKRLTQGVVDQYAPLKELDFRSYVLARMSKGTDGTFEGMLYYGRPQVVGDTVEIDTAPGGLMEVLSTLSGEQDRFLAWIAANRAEQLSAEGREFLFTPAQIQELKGLNQGQMADGRGRQVEYARVLREFNAFQDSVLAIAEARGLIDAESRQVWRDGFYVPFYRNMEDGTTGPSVKSGLVNQYAFKKLKGSSRQLNEDLLANTLQNMAHLLSAAAKNQAASASLRAAESAGVAHRVPSGTKGAVRFLDAGREQHYLVDDPFIYDAITSLESVKVVGLEKVLSKFKHWLTMGVTINPAFQLRSLMRDAIQSIAITNIDTNPLANVKQGIASQLAKDQDYINALASGGLIRFNSLLEGNRADHTRKLIKMGVADSTILDTREKVEMFFTKALDKWLAVGDISESTNRMALYKQQIAAGVDPLLAAYQARDLMDFSMQGQWRAVRFLTQVVPFLNARLQGLYKLGRDGVVPTGRVLFGGGDATDKQIAKRFGAVTGAVAMASIALMAAYADDEDWKKREDWDRDTYWWFKIGDTAFRIPKPFEVGAIGTIAERTAELFMTDDLSGDRFLQRLGHMMSSTFALNPIPQMVKPLLDVYANEESFTQRPIETMGMERLQPQDRFTGSTSELAKWLGQLGLPEPGRLMSGQYQALSPVQIDALIRGYFSWLGVSATRVVDMGVRAVADRPARPEMQLRDVFFAGNFVEGLPANSSRYVTALYDQSKAIESAYASYRFALRQGDQARATELLAEDGDKIRLNPLVTRAKQTMSKLNENIRAIERNMTMSPVEKRAQIDRIKAMQNQIAMRISAQLQ